MSDQSSNWRPLDGQQPRTAQLDSVSEELDAVFESLDLGKQPQVAEAVALAIRATGRARELASDKHPDGLGEPDETVRPR